mgnify:CR=1 FL=1
MLLEAEDTRRIVQQYVGIQHIELVLAVVLEIFVSFVRKRRFFKNFFGFSSAAALTSCLASLAEIGSTLVFVLGVFAAAGLTAAALVLRGARAAFGAGA